MTSHKDRKGVQQLAQEYGMLESDVRQMLAFQDGETKGDVIDVESKTPGPIGRFLRVVATLGLSLVFRSGR